MKWFKHDSDAGSDAKLMKVRIKYGMEGYGLYWYCLELIVNGISESNLTFELEHDAEIISHQTGIHFERVQEMMTFMIDLGLFEGQGGRITCLKILKRLDKSMTSNKSFREMLDTAKESHDSVMTVPDLVMQDETRLDLTTQDKKHTRARKRAPTSYQPSKELLASLATETNSKDWQLNDLLNEMKDHEFKSAKKDWDAVFRNWVRRSTRWNTQPPAETSRYREL